MYMYTNAAIKYYTCIISFISIHVQKCTCNRTCTVDCTLHVRAFIHNVIIVVVSS